MLHSAETELLCVGLSDVEQSLELNRTVCSVVERIVRDVPRTRNPLVELLVFFFSDLKQCETQIIQHATRVSGWVGDEWRRGSRVGSCGC